MRLIDADILFREVEESKISNPHKQSVVAQNHENEHRHFERMICDSETFDIDKHDKEVKQPYIDEIKALRWLLRCAVDCDFGLDNFEEEYEKYKFYVDEDMSYIDMMITIAHHVVEEEGAVF